MKTRNFIFAAMAGLALVALPMAEARAAECPGANAVRNAAADFIQATRQGSTAAFASALARNADVRGTALFALGQYRKNLPAGRQRQYMQLAQAYMAQFLRQHSGPFRSYRDLTIESCRGNLVETSLAGRSRMVWRLSGRRIGDVQVSGVWLALQLRSKFTGIIRRNGGSTDALIDFLARSGN
jgi:ABC-type transporter MlaC component